MLTQCEMVHGARMKKSVFLGILAFLLLSLFIPRLSGTAYGSGFGHVNAVMAKDTFLLTEQVKIGISVYGDDLTGPAGLYMRFNQAQNNYTGFFNKFLTVDGEFDTPQAIIPGVNFDVTNFNLDCSDNGPCLLDFPASILGIGSYSFTFFLADATKPVQVTQNGDGYFFTQDDTELPITTIEFTIAEGTCNTCSCGAFAAQNPCLCDPAYASSHPTECQITATAIVGSWNEQAHNADNTYSVTGTRQFLSDNTFIADALYNDGTKRLSKGEWSYDNGTLSYKYTDVVKTTADGSTQHCWATTWPDGMCDDGTTLTTPFASGEGTVDGTAQSFTITQNNGWVGIFTRQ